MVFMVFLYYLILFFMVMLSVAFVTLLERKILGLIQARPGPNKVGLGGVVQPFSDGVKLLGKSSISFIFIKGVMYGFMPYLMFFVMFIMWSFLPDHGGLCYFKNGILLIVAGFSLSVYPIMVGSWFSLSLYSMVGAVRSIAQIISYEVSLIMIIVSFLCFTGGFSVYGFKGSLFLIFFYPLLFLFFLSMLIELSRSPSDLIEGESELVSGFNIEFYGLNFAFIFLGEYGMIIFSSALLVNLGVGVSPLSGVGLILVMGVVYLIIFLRGSLPRLRYDELMSLCWVSMISFSISYFIFLFGVLRLLW